MGPWLRPLLEDSLLLEIAPLNHQDSDFHDEEDKFSTKTTGIDGERSTLVFILLAFDKRSIPLF